MRIALDAMGGDYAPKEVVEGALLAREELGIDSILVGDETKIISCLKEASAYPSLEIVHAREKVTMSDSPTGLRQKRDSSIVVAAQLVREKKAQGIVSAGNTGASMVAVTFALGRIQGVKRPSIATLLPAFHGSNLLLDVGGGLEHRWKNVLHSALMGRVYAQKILHRENPRVGLLNVGEEEEKGPVGVQETYQRLKALCPGFVGNAEGHHLFSPDFDVIVSDGYVGNITLKAIEGTAKLITNLLKEELSKTPLSRLGALFLKRRFSSVKEKLDYASYGGAPLLGVRGNVIISHGRSKSLAIKNAIRIASAMAKERMVESITLELETSAARARGEDENEKEHTSRDRCLCTEEGTD